MIYKFQNRTGVTAGGSSDGPANDTNADSIAIKVAIDFCLNIGITKFLFSEIY